MDKYAPGCAAKFSDPDLFLTQFKEEEERKQRAARAAKEERRRARAARREVCAVLVLRRQRWPRCRRPMCLTCWMVVVFCAPCVQKHKAKRARKEVKKPAVDLNWRAKQAGDVGVAQRRVSRQPPSYVWGRGCVPGCTRVPRYSHHPLPRCACATLALGHSSVRAHRRAGSLLTPWAYTSVLLRL